MGKVRNYSILMYLVLLKINTYESATSMRMQTVEKVLAHQSQSDVGTEMNDADNNFYDTTSARPGSEKHLVKTKAITDNKIQPLTNLHNLKLTDSFQSSTRWYNSKVNEHSEETFDPQLHKKEEENKHLDGTSSLHNQFKDSKDRKSKSYLQYFAAQTQRTGQKSDTLDIFGNKTSGFNVLKSQTIYPKRNIRNSNQDEHMHNHIVKSGTRNFENHVILYNTTPSEFQGADSVRNITHERGNVNSTIQGKQSPLICLMEVQDRGQTIFQSHLISREPNFIQFSLKVCDGQQSISPNFTSDVFQGLRWFWTYNTSSGPYPFLSWNLDYGILSFHLLEAGTINIPYVCINIKPYPYPSSKCKFTFGEERTSLAVTSALIPLINVTEGDDYIKYPESYFCYLSVRQEYFGTLHYWAAIYLYYPIPFTRYKCCAVSYNYTGVRYHKDCYEKYIPGVHSWVITKYLPYFLGILFLLYFPVMFFNIAAWLAKEEQIHEDTAMFGSADDDVLGDNWLFADGNPPLTLGDLFSFKTFGLRHHPIITSRVRRLLFVLSFPMFIYLQLAMYSDGMGQWRDKITVRDLVKAGTPMGFLALLADVNDMRRVFIPILGGPIGVVTIYYTLSLLFIALPRSVKQVVETGLPSSNLIINSPLFFGTSEIIQMSRIEVKSHDLKPGYTKASTLMKCRFYMLFTGVFWKELWKILIGRITCLKRSTSFCGVLLIYFTLPFYILFCVIEVVCCIVFHGLPFCTFVSGMLNGGLKSLRYLRGQSLFLDAVFKYRIPCFFGISFVFTSFMVYVYVISITFIISFSFLSQVITHCFVAIIIYPSVSFGYLFFFIVLFYYFINLVRDFGGGYMELLATTVDISRHLSNDGTKVAVNDGHLTVSNAKVENIVDVRINGILLQVCPNILQRIPTERDVKVKERNSTFGIPKQLFEYIVKKHRPIHQQVVILCFKSIIMITFVILTLSISADYVAGPTTEISEVMHVIFIVAIGALPQLVQAILSRSDTVLVREIEEREIEKSVEEFWNKEAVRKREQEMTLYNRV